MKRLMIAAALLLATASISVRAQAPGQSTPQAAMPMHQMMHGMMHGQPQVGANQPDQVQGGMKCCEMSKSDKSQ